MINLSKVNNEQEPPANFQIGKKIKFLCLNFSLFFNFFRNRRKTKCNKTQFSM